MQVQDRIRKLQEYMSEQEIHAYIVPTADYHESEYVGDYFKCRKFLTGFTGSAGTAVVMQDQAFLWTDGRYFLQAERELDGSGIILQKSGEEGVPTITEFLKQRLPEKGNIGFDGRTVGMAKGQEYEKIASDRGGRILYERDLIDLFWEERPKLSEEPAFLLEVKYAGETAAEKLKRVRAVMQKSSADSLVITSLDDIGWLLNIRGADVAFCPLLLSYAVVKMDVVELYTGMQKLSDEIRASFRENGVVIYPYEDIYERVKRFPEGEGVLLDPKQMNYALYKNIPAGVRIIQKTNPIILMKSVKNSVEVENIRKAHLKDGIAHTKFMYWLKEHVGKGEETITELSASAKLEEFRGMQAHFIGPSFAPICAYQDHAAIVHYSSSPETNVELEAKGLFLTDTGGHYYEGSTDITRTVALGEITEEERKHFTTVVCSMLHLADAKFPYGCTGMTLDYAAREPFWRQGLNYNHGTGHGVGYLGNIHEGPARISWKVIPDEDAPCTLEENMVITDEPGIYIENSHGIRIENELLVCRDEKNVYGRFLHFEVLTCVPVDLDAIDPKQMSPQEKELLNTYHQRVYEQISPHLSKEEQRWLKKYTRAV